jgi:hypothetical protein
MVLELFVSVLQPVAHQHLWIMLLYQFGKGLLYAEGESSVTQKQVVSFGLLFCCIQGDEHHGMRKSLGPVFTYVILELV